VKPIRYFFYGGFATLMIGVSLLGGRPTVADAENPCLTGTPDPVAFGARTVGSTTVIKLTVTNNCKLNAGEEVKIAKDNIIGGEGALNKWKAGEDNCPLRKFTKQGETCTTEFAFEPPEAKPYEATVEYEYNGGTYPVKLTGTGRAPC
jgi:hypothetical protein